jgi:hypothetical protein
MTLMRTPVTIRIGSEQVSARPERLSDALAAARLVGAVDEESGDGQVLDRDADRVVQGDLVVGGSPGPLAGDDLSEFGAQVVRGDDPVGEGQHAVAGLPDGDWWSSTTTVALAMPALSISRWSGRGGAPTALMCCPGRNHAPLTIGSREGVRVQTTSAAATTSRGVSTTVTGSPSPATCVRKASRVAGDRDHTTTCSMGSTAQTAVTSRRHTASTRPNTSAAAVPHDEPCRGSRLTRSNDVVGGSLGCNIANRGDRRCRGGSDSTVARTGCTGLTNAARSVSATLRRPGPPTRFTPHGRLENAIEPINAANVLSSTEALFRPPQGRPGSRPARIWSSLLSPDPRSARRFGHAWRGRW